MCLSVMQYDFMISSLGLAQPAGRELTITLISSPVAQHTGTEGTSGPVSTGREVSIHLQLADVVDSCYQYYKTERRILLWSHLLSVWKTSAWLRRHMKRPLSLVCTLSSVTEQLLGPGEEMET